MLDYPEGKERRKRGRRREKERKREGEKEERMEGYFLFYNITISKIHSLIT